MHPRLLPILFMLLSQLLAVGKEPVRLSANNAKALRAALGQSATVSGKVSRSSVSKGGHHFLNFYSSDLTVVCFREHVSKFKPRGPALEYRDKHVLVTGSIELYRGKLQIKLTSPTQIQLDQQRKSPQTSDSKPALTNPPPDSTSPATEKFRLKQLGKDRWLSPAGLRYSGKDAQGRTRVEHVLRHAADQPRRAGPHGVFDGGRDQALSIVDEAWTMAKKKKLAPVVQGKSSAYTISMGRRVGYLGGRTGARRKHPPLRNVFLVVRTGTSEVITAFPK